MEWVRLALEGLLYLIAVVVMYPLLVLCRIDRAPHPDDGVHLGYDDNDAGKDIDDVE